MWQATSISVNVMYFSLKTVGHFRVQKTLTFKIRPSAQPCLWKWVLFALEWKIISIWKAEHLTSFSYRGPGELGNDIFSLSDNLPAERAPDCWAGVAGSIPGQTHYLPGFLKHCLDLVTLRCWSFFSLILSYQQANFTLLIIQLIYPQKFFISFVFSFSWEVDCCIQEKLESKVKKNGFWKGT